MKSSTYLIRLSRAFILGAAVAGTAASAAGAQALVGRPPDVRDAAGALAYQSQSAVVPDVLERFAATHPYGIGLSATTGSTLVGRPPDVRDAAQANMAVPDVLERFAATHPYGIGLSATTGSTLVGRPPDVRDAAQAARTSSFSQSSAFDWGDYAIGIGTGIGLILFLVGGLAIGRQRRHSMQTA